MSFSAFEVSNITPVTADYTTTTTSCQTETHKHTYLVYWLQVHEFLCFQASIFTPVAALAAVAAVLRAASCLDAQQRATLDLHATGRHSEC